jgi:transcriptional regulator with XRE-family HTH domain
VVTASKLLAKNLKALREAHGMSQTELAKAIGVTHGIVSMWESEKSWVSPENLDKLAKVLKVTVATLFANQAKSEKLPTINLPKPELSLSEALRVVETNLGIALKKSRKK